MNDDLIIKDVIDSDGQLAILNINMCKMEILCAHFLNSYL